MHVPEQERKLNQNRNNAETLPCANQSVRPQMNLQFRPECSGAAGAAWPTLDVYCNKTCLEECNNEGVRLAMP